MHKARGASFLSGAQGCVILGMCPMRTCTGTCASCSTAPVQISVTFGRPGNQYSLAAWGTVCTLSLSDKLTHLCLWFNMSSSDGISKSQAKLKPVFPNENWFYSVASAMLTLFFHLILQMHVHPCDDEGYSEEG